MSVVTETMSLLEILPTQDQLLVNEVVKKLVKAWDPDFTKLTPTEAKELDDIITSVNNGEYVTDDEVWD